MTSQAPLLAQHGRATFPLSGVTDLSGGDAKRRRAADRPHSLSLTLTQVSFALQPRLALASIKPERSCLRQFQVMSHTHTHTHSRGRRGMAKCFFIKTLLFYGSKCNSARKRGRTCRPDGKFCSAASNLLSSCASRAAGELFMLQP